MYSGIKDKLINDIKDKLELQRYQLTGTAFYGKETPIDLDILVYAKDLTGIMSILKNDFNITSELGRVNAYANILGTSEQYKSKYFDFLVFTDKEKFDKNITVTLALKEVFNQEEGFFYTNPTKSERAMIYEKGIELLTYNKDLTSDDLIEQLKRFMETIQQRIRRIQRIRETTENLQAVLKVLDDLLVLNLSRECPWGTLHKEFDRPEYHFTIKGYYTYTIKVLFSYNGIELEPELTAEQEKNKRLLEIKKRHLSEIHYSALFAGVFEMVEIMKLMSSIE